MTARFGAIRPEVRVSDMLSSQRAHGALWQVCLAHLLRDRGNAGRGAVSNYLTEAIPRTTPSTLPMADREGTSKSAP